MPKLTDMRLRLTLTEATEIKARIWAGDTQAAVSSQFHVSQVTISRIVHGEQWPSAQWPDQSSGPIPQGKAEELSRGPRSRILEGAQESLILPPPGAVQVPVIPTPTPPEAKVEGWPKENIVKRDFEPPNIPVTPEEREATLALMGDALDQQLSSELEAALTTIDEGADRSSQPVAEAEAELIYDKMSWLQVLEAAPRNKLVILAEAANDTILKEAISIVFKNLPKEDWKRQVAADLVSQTADSIVERKGRKE